MRSTATPPCWRRRWWPARMRNGATPLAPLSPCSFVSLREDATATDAELITFCRQHLAGFKLPKTVVFGPLPKTSTGKMQKYVQRERARALDHQPA